MGNCFVLSKQEKVLRVVKTDGKVLEFRAPTLVKDMLMNFSGSGISVSKQASELLPPNYKLKLGKKRTGAATRRIKIFITKQQLQELLTKKISVQEVLSASGLEQKSSLPQPRPPGIINLSFPLHLLPNSHSLNNRNTLYTCHLCSFAPASFVCLHLEKKKKGLDPPWSPDPPRPPSPPQLPGVGVLPPSA
ncbi:unnamed protein product [Prunus armeniaca]